MESTKKLKGDNIRPLRTVQSSKKSESDFYQTVVDASELLERQKRIEEARDAVNRRKLQAAINEQEERKYSMLFTAFWVAFGTVCIGGCLALGWQLVSKVMG